MAGFFLHETKASEKECAVKRPADGAGKRAVEGPAEGEEAIGDSGRPHMDCT